MCVCLYKTLVCVKLLLTSTKKYDFVHRNKRFFLAVLTVIVRKNQTLPLVLRSTTKKNVNVPPNSKYRPKDCFVKPKHVAKLCINCYILMCESGKKTLY